MNKEQKEIISTTTEYLQSYKIQEAEIEEIIRSFTENDYDDMREQGATEPEIMERILYNKALDPDTLMENISKQRQYTTYSNGYESDLKKNTNTILSSGAKSKTTEKEPFLTKKKIIAIIGGSALAASLIFGGASGNTIDNNNNDHGNASPKKEQVVKKATTSPEIASKISNISNDTIIKNANSRSMEELQSDIKILEDSIKLFGKENLTTEDKKLNNDSWDILTNIYKAKNKAPLAKTLKEVFETRLKNGEKVIISEITPSKIEEKTETKKKEELKEKEITDKKLLDLPEKKEFVNPNKDEPTYDELFKMDYKELSKYFDKYNIMEDYFILAPQASQSRLATTVYLHGHGQHIADEITHDILEVEGNLHNIAIDPSKYKNIVFGGGIALTIGDGHEFEALSKESLKELTDLGEANISDDKLTKMHQSLKKVAVYNTDLYHLYNYAKFVGKEYPENYDPEKKLAEQEKAELVKNIQIKYGSKEEPRSVKSCISYAGNMIEKIIYSDNKKTLNSEFDFKLSKQGAFNVTRTAVIKIIGLSIGRIEDNAETLGIKDFIFNPDKILLSPASVATISQGYQRGPGMVRKNLYKGLIKNDMGLTLRENLTLTEYKRRTILEAKTSIDRSARLDTEHLIELKTDLTDKKGSYDILFAQFNETARINALGHKDKDKFGYDYFVGKVDEALAIHAKELHNTIENIDKLDNDALTSLYQKLSTNKDILPAMQEAAKSAGIKPAVFDQERINGFLELTINNRNNIGYKIQRELVSNAKGGK